MKKYIHILLSTVMVLAMLGCSDGGQEEPTPDPVPPKPSPVPGQEPRATPYYITDYLIVNSIGVRCRDGWLDPTDGLMGYDLFPLKGDVIEVGLYGESVTEESNSELFAYFQEQNGDVYYTGETQPHQTKALAYPFEKITMLCHENFDAEHPAGAVVDDIVKIHISTYAPYIANGYAYPEGWEHRRYYHYWGITPVGEFYLSEINSETAQLLSPSMVIMKFMQEPVVAGEYPFTLTITMNGEEISKTFKVTFGETTAEE